jgi:ankyrin repeat protein
MLSESDFVGLVKQGDQSEVERGLKLDPSLAFARSEDVSAVLWAMYYGHPALARYLADAKGQLDIFEAAALGDRHVLPQRIAEHPDAVNRFSADGFTPLGLAAFFGHLEVVQELLRMGADPNLPSKNPLSVLPLHSALADGRKEIARVLISAKTDVNAANGEGWTPLHYTASNGDVETTELLLSKGANSKAARTDGATPADLAREKGHLSLAARLS